MEPRLHLHATMDLEQPTREGAMNLIGYMKDRKPEYLPSFDLQAVKKGQLIYTSLKTNEIYGPFESIEQIEAWIKDRES